MSGAALDSGESMLLLCATKPLARLALVRLELRRLRKLRKGLASDAGLEFRAPSCVALAARFVRGPHVPHCRARTLCHPHNLVDQDVSLPRPTQRAAVAIELEEYLGRGAPPQEVGGTVHA
eukprot:scaffold103675_cov70-Phaeocystis_antarctica.AAC.5